MALLPQLEQQVVAQENALSILTGKAPAAIERTTALAEVTLHDSLPVAIPVNMISHRPDIRQAEMAAAQAHAQVNVAKASMYPTLTISAQGGLNTFEASKWFNVPGSLFALGSGSLLQPLLQNKRLKTQYEQSKIAREQSELQFKQSALNALGEVSNVLVMVAKLKQQETHTAKQLSILDGAVKNATKLYDNGDASYLEVLTAQNNKLQAGLTLASLQRQRLNAEVLLYQSLGGGWR